MTATDQHEFAVEPIWDGLIAERGGRLPHQFEGHSEWDESEEAKTAEARGRAEAEATAEMFFGHDPTIPREWGPSLFDEDTTDTDLDGIEDTDGD